MAAVSMALALLGGVIGAGFASGREILRFFAIYGRAAPAAIVCACALMLMLIWRLPALMQAHNVHSLKALCQIRLGRRFGFLCSALLIDRLKATFQWIKRNYKYINLISGGFLILIGILMACGLLGRFLTMLS